MQEHTPNAYNVTRADNRHNCIKGRVGFGVKETVTFHPENTHYLN